ncbi:DUF2934 domain-containing protein [Nitrosomonas aestuarii]|uniref:DUF2934 domain-containing protein n=1 Tax=Nitrosomonas aestuarii TaxID=52441 RepID=UPI000D314EDB|nr:DUF2934 domain-containing protein [Nitrosomonas aestuarii]PTN12857.1 Protein of unknown function (DUF2934) [Nitrosomonas aestuarii]
MESVKAQPKRTKNTKKKFSVIDSGSISGLTEEDRNVRIAVSAYYKAQARGFEPGYELTDWLAAEAELRQ